MGNIEYDEMFVPVFTGTNEVLYFGADTLLDLVDRDTLYKRYWKASRLKGDEYKRSVEEVFEPAFQGIKEELLKDDILVPKALYGVFNVYTDDTVLVFLDPADTVKELIEFEFPRVERSSNRSFTDFFRPEADVAGVQVVTIGPDIDRRAEEYFNQNKEYTQGFYMSGLADYLTELLAERVTTEVRLALGVPKAQGKRFSFGYPGMPPVSEQRRLFEILAVEERLGISLTEKGQMVPEHSTSALFTPHRSAHYL
ncbi:MAG: vitamin B12 dependent-methionine synthase activation domain-containing protein [Chitinivibrionales bacterium]